MKGRAFLFLLCKQSFANKERNGQDKKSGEDKNGRVTFLYRATTSSVLSDLGASWETKDGQRAATRHKAAIVRSSNEA